jgi:hypothetical protein
MKRGSFRILFFVAAIVLIFWSLHDSRFYDSEGALTGRFCLPLSTAIALLALALNFSRVGFWLSLGLAGQAALLQTIDAGKSLHYQHYRFFNSPPTFLLLVQTVCVAVGLWKRRTSWHNWVRKHGTILSAAVLLLAAISAAASENIAFYFLETVFVTFMTIVQIGNLYLLLREIRPGFFLTRLRHFFETSGSLPVILAFFVTLVGIFLNLFVYQRHPHVNDEVAYLFQARMFANGHLTIPSPPVPEAFDVYLFDFSRGRMFVVPPPGWPAILALGVLIHAPWLINPVLAGFNILLAHFVLKWLYNIRIANISVLLLALSPWNIFMSMNFMTHQWSATCALLTAVGLIQTIKRGQIWWSLFAGFFIGIQSLIRPLDGLIIAILSGCWVLASKMVNKMKFVSLIALAIGTLFTGGLIFPYNKFFTGDFFTYPINAYNELRFGKNANAYGFGKDYGMRWPLDPFPGHGPLDGAVNAQLNSSQVNAELFGWPIGSLSFFLLFLLARRFSRSDYLLLSVLITIFTAYYFYYFSGGPDFGARYWFLMIVPLVALSSRGLDWVQNRIDPAGSQMFNLVIVLVFFAVINYLPWRALDKYYHYLRMRPDICHILPNNRDSKDLVLVQGERFPNFASSMACNPLDLSEGTPIFAWDRNPIIRNELLKYYSDRTIWTVQGPSLTGNGYKVVARSK